MAMLSRERWSACTVGCTWEYGADSCQAYGQPCIQEGQPRQEFACHALVCCGACPLPWPRSYSIDPITAIPQEANAAKDPRN